MIEKDFKEECYHSNCTRNATQDQWCYKCIKFDKDKENNTTNQMCNQCNFKVK